MDIFTFLYNCVTAKENGQKEGYQGPLIATLISFLIIVPGIIFSSFHIGFYGSNWSDWLWNTNAALDSTFLSKKGRIQVVNLKGQWRFELGDDTTWALPEFDDSPWPYIEVPSRWEGEALEDYDGYAWYRRNFDLDADGAQHPLYAVLGKIDDVDQVFINGRSIGSMGSFPPMYSSAWDLERIYHIPENVVHSGTNLIAIRVYDGYLRGGITGKTIGLYTTGIIQPLIDLSGNWKLKAGHNPDWKNETVDETGFTNVYVPMSWDNAGYQDYDGHAWYRITFGRLPLSADETMVLLLGKVDDTDEVFLNGKLIGHTGPLGYSNEKAGGDSYNKNRIYEFPSSLLQDGNTLAVHVFDGHSRGGIYEGPVGIMAKTDYLAYRKQLGIVSKWNLDDAIDWLLGRD